ncbi:MAG: anhydro-N-acetylmuramic acid kinase [Burkholderiales bacterium]|nr:anhydro-N-acetylmuramic acid kinase [Burkholderiales bacterium]
MQNPIYLGLMSGTSLDGVDGVAVQFFEDEHGVATLLAHAHLPYTPELRQHALDLQQAGDNEIHHEALLGNALAHIYADCVQALRTQLAGDAKIRAVGVHGQTIRHRPELGYTRQTNQPALLAELCGIDVIADFRSRDIAAGGQGAPLVPAFHRAVFGQANQTRVVLNIGGISNISILHADGSTLGFDTGPGNVLMDAWIARHLQQTYDHDGAWAASGHCHAALLHVLLQETYFDLPPPKSTGRDLFHLAWLEQQLQKFPPISPADVQASLAQFTVTSIADAIKKYAPDCSAVYVCGGGAFNAHLMQNLSRALTGMQVASTAELGIAPQHVEAIAFAWLAARFDQRLPGNLSEVTGARGPRILGALYPA